VKQDKLAGLFTRASMALAQSVCAGVGHAAIEAAEGEDFPNDLEEDHGQKRPRSRKRKAQVAARPAKKVLNLGFLHQRE
jgi:hypothetical protein